MSMNFAPISLLAVLAALVLPGAAHAQGMPNLAGNYRCLPEPSSCQWQGQTITISQSGNTAELKVDQKEFAQAKLTSNITLSAGPPFNAMGRILPDNSIEWSNGTKWVRQ